VDWSDETLIRLFITVEVGKVKWSAWKLGGEFTEGFMQ
jgi:hypothetical protein